jgi:hypothetical protein
MFYEQRRAHDSEADSERRIVLTPVALVVLTSAGISVYRSLPHHSGIGLLRMHRACGPVCLRQTVDALLHIAAEGGKRGFSSSIRENSLFVFFLC